MLLDNITNAFINGGTVQEIWFGGNKIYGKAEEKQWVLNKSVDERKSPAVSLPTDHRYVKIVVHIDNTYSNVKFDARLNSYAVTIGEKTAKAKFDLEILLDQQTFEWSSTGVFENSGKHTEQFTTITISGAYVYASLEVYVAD